MVGGWALLLAIGISLGIEVPPASAQQAGMLTVNPTSGPVGTVVHLSGIFGPGCTSQNTFGVTFESPSPYGPEEGVAQAPGSDGSWSATFVVPPYVGGAATRRAGDLTTGTWDFVTPESCHPLGPLRSVAFTVTSTTPPPSRFMGMAPTPEGKGYWLAQAGGGVFSYGDAGFYGSLPGLGITPAAPITGIASTPDGKGYWLVGADGGVFAFGDAGFFGSATGGGRGGATALLPTRDGEGYVMAFAEAAGSVASFGDAPSLGASGPSLPTLLAGGALTPNDQGFWEVGTDGGVFAFGSAKFYGSLPGLGITPVAPITGIASTPAGKGYWLVGADGAVFAFGDAGFFGSAA